MKGRGLAKQHRRKAERCEEGRIPTIAMDYCFIGSKGEKFKTFLVIKDDENGSLKAIKVDAKGAGDGWIVKRLVELIDKIWGKKNN